MNYMNCGYNTLTKYEILWFKWAQFARRAMYKYLFVLVAHFIRYPFIKTLVVLKLHICSK